MKVVATQDIWGKRRFGKIRNTSRQMSLEGTDKCPHVHKSGNVLSTSAMILSLSIIECMLTSL